MSGVKSSIYRWLPPLMILLLFVGLFLQSRVNILLRSEALFSDPEELVNGILPLHLERGLMQPIHRYQYEHYAGGTVVLGLASYLPFRLFGPSEFSLKLGASLFSLATLIVLFLLLWRYFHPAAAIVFGLIFLHPPAGYLQGSLFAYGNHTEIIAFAALSFFLLSASRLQTGERKIDRAKRHLLVFFFGLVAGFGCYFDYIYLIFLAALLLFAIVPLRGRSFFTFVIVFLLGMRIGLIPWYVFHKDQTFLYAVFRFYWPGAAEQAASSTSLPQFFSHALMLLTNIANWFKPYPPVQEGSGLFIRFLNLCLWLVFAGGFFYLLVRYRKALGDFLAQLRLRPRRRLVWSKDHLMIPILIYAPLHLIAYAFYQDPNAPMAPHPRYLQPLFLPFFLIVSAALAELWTSHKRIFAVAGIALVLFAGIGGSRYLHEKGQTDSRQRAGYDYRYFFLSDYSVPFNEAAYRQLVEEGFPAEQQTFFAGVNAGLAYLQGREIGGHVSAAEKEGQAAWAAFVTGLGCATQMSNRSHADRIKSITNLFSDSHTLDFARGIEIGKQIRKAPLS